MQNNELYNLLKDGESEHLAFRQFFGYESIETLVAFANSQGGVLLIGISELKEINGVVDAKDNINQWFNEIHTRTTPRLSPYIEIIEIEKKQVVYISVAEYPVKPVAFEGKYYKRLGKFTRELSVSEAIDFRRQSMNSHWDSNLRPGKTITNLSFSKLHNVIERISRKKQCLQEEPFAFLRKYSLTEEDAVTNACWLLFLPEEEPDATIELGRFSSPTTTSDSLTLKTDLFTEAEEAMRFICKHISKETHPDEPAQWQYPLEAIRELVVNMIIHRDYTSDYHSMIKIFDDYIEFYNPGALTDDLYIKRLLSNGYFSRPRNPQISEVFKEAGMFDEYGCGIRQAYTAFIDAGLRLPEFIKLPNRLIVRVFGDTSNHWEKKKKAAVSVGVIERLNTVKRSETVVEPSSLFDNADFTENSDEVEDVDSALLQEPMMTETSSDCPDSGLPPEQVSNHFSVREQQIIELITNNNRIPLNTIAANLTVSKRTILRDIKKLKAEKIIDRMGSEKNGYWKINI